MYDIIRIHSLPVVFDTPAVEVSTLSTIPEYLREAISIVNCELWLDNENGYQTAPIGSIICCEKSSKTASGYNCWAIGKLGIDLEKKDGVFYTKPTIIHAMLIPAKDDSKPLWVNACDIIYNGDGTATLKTDCGQITGRIGIDFLLCLGRKENGKPKAAILSTYDKSYTDYIICDKDGNDLGKLCEFYPA